MMGSALSSIGSMAKSAISNPAVGQAVGGALGGYLGGGSKIGSAQDAALAGNQQSWTDIGLANDMNRSNASWGMEQNQASGDRALQQNRPDQISDFGSSTWSQGPDGQWSQNLSLAPGQQDLLGALRRGYGLMGDKLTNEQYGGRAEGLMDGLYNKYETIGSGMGGGFDVQGDVMNAMRAQMAPGLQQQRDQENARLAAMGLSTGSGAAWGQSQDALNRSANDAEQKAILGGFNADQQLRQSNRADMGALAGMESMWGNQQQQYQQGLRSNLGLLGNLETGWRNNMNMPNFSQAGAPTMGQINVNAPQNRTTESMWLDQNRAQGAADQWGQLGGALGGAASSWFGGK